MNRVDGLRLIRAIVFWLQLLFLFACVSNNPFVTEDHVRERAQGWLDALMAFDVERAYDHTSPAYQSAHSMAWYSRNYAGRNMWKSAFLGDIRCDGSEEFGRCEVDIIVTYRGFNMKADMETILTEVWVKLDGNWYTLAD